MPSTSAPPSAQIAAVSTPDAGVGTPAGASLDLALKALLEESRSTQASIQQLTHREQSDGQFAIFSNHPVILGVEGILLGATVLVLGGFLGYVLRRVQTPGASTHADFHESVYQFRAEDEYLPPTAHGAPQPTPTGDESFAEPNDDTTAPLEAQEDATQDNPYATLFAPSESGMGFDVEAAAGEVQRVRRSLAEKRAARAAWTMQDTIFPHPTPTPQEEPALPDPAVAAPAEFTPMGLDLDLDLDLNGSELEPAHPLESPGLADSLAPEPEPEPEPVADADADVEAQGVAVKLALAQEFMALGLWEGARELAVEVSDSPDIALHAQATELIQQINTLEQEQQDALKSIPTPYTSVSSE